MKALLLSELIVTAILVGLIWVIQVLTYPSFEFVGSEQYTEYHRFHVAAITPLVGPLMIAEALLCANNCFSGLYSIYWSIGFLIILTLIWGATAFFSVPLHNQLVLSKDTYLIQKLVLSNWVRTILWTLKLSMMIYLVPKN